MKNRLIYLILIITFITSPLLAIADGGFIKPLPNGDWALVDENSQQAFINYEGNIERLIVAADIKEENSDIAWIIPVPGESDKVEIDITSELPNFFGDDVISKAKLSLSESLKTSYYAGLLGQVWTFPFSIIFVSLGGARSGGSGNGVPGDLISVEAHIEKAGMIAEVITAKNGQAIYNYFSQKGFNIKQGSISELDSYVDKDYSFVVSWIAPGAVSEGNKGERGIFINFPTPKIYYPLILTSVYGETKIPITIRVLDHVKPEFSSETKPYTEVSYFTERTKAVGSTARCQARMSQFRAIMEMYHSSYNSYPSSLQGLANDKDLGDETKALLEDINRYCYYPLLYNSKNSNDYTIKMRLSSGVYEINSSGSSGFIDKNNFYEEEIISPELQKFYGNKKPWAGEADYTKISINAPAKLLKQDLWMENGRPFKISSAMWAINNPWVVILILYLVIVGISSFIAGGIAGLICFRKFKKYALLGLSNIATLIGLILVFNYIKKKREEVKYSKLSFGTLFSIIFVLLLSLLQITPIFQKDRIEVGWLVIIAVAWVVISWVILLFIEFLLNKIALKNRVIRALLIILLFIIFWVAIGSLFFSFL
jgi:hypothetical protein